jgi:hypothetical protein
MEHGSSGADRHSWSARRAVSVVPEHDGEDGVRALRIRGQPRGVGNVHANLNILPEPQRRLCELRDTPQAFVLYGGTALASTFSRTERGSSTPASTEGDLRGGDRAGLRPEKLGTQPDPAQLSAGARQDHAEPGSAATGTGVGSAQGSHPADAGLDRDFPPLHLSANSLASTWTSIRSPSGRLLTRASCATSARPRKF